MTLALDAATAGALAAVGVAGDVDVATAPELRTWLARLLDAGATRLVVDVSGVTFLDSSGLGVLVAAHRRLARDGGRLEIVGAGGAVARLLEITALTRLFDVRLEEAPVAVAAGDGAPG